MRTLLIMAFLAVIWPIHGVFGAETSVDMGKIAMIESSGCKNLVGDNGKALGCYQLHAGVIKEYNQFRKASLKHSDVMNRVVGLKVADWYMNKRIPAMLKHFGKADTVENRLTAYNRGIQAVIDGKRAGKYIAKYNRIK